MIKRFLGPVLDAIRAADKWALDASYKLLERLAAWAERVPFVGEIWVGAMALLFMSSVLRLLYDNALWMELVICVAFVGFLMMQTFLVRVYRSLFKSCSLLATSQHDLFKTMYMDTIERDTLQRELISLQKKVIDGEPLSQEQTEKLAKLQAAIFATPDKIESPF